MLVSKLLNSPSIVYRRPIRFRCRSWLRTGEVGCIGDDVSEAILKSMLSVGQRIPEKNILLSTGTAKQKVAMLDAARLLARKDIIFMLLAEPIVSSLRTVFRAPWFIGRVKRERNRRL
mgnify:CR=1 FL=1